MSKYLESDISILYLYSRIFEFVFKLNIIIEVISKFNFIRILSEFCSTYLLCEYATRLVSVARVALQRESYMYGVLKKFIYETFSRMGVTFRDESNDGN